MEMLQNFLRKDMKRTMRKQLFQNPWNKFSRKHHHANFSCAAVKTGGVHCKNSG